MKKFIENQCPGCGVFSWEIPENRINHVPEEAQQIVSEIAQSIIHSITTMVTGSFAHPVLNIMVAEKLVQTQLELDQFTENALSEKALAIGRARAAVNN